ncbi:histone-lysine N-methyltransferase SETMAR-like [Orussus abietinus]|uniref:histone-lysine N-methyltransferase SETMAR-like n=1 Tax=Orussus abietinus TaxID=222816 RepID=UPI000C716079|nr:histone-lysine N-methyltransferase SETMAR-like [Orussus abietinus]
MGITQIKEWYNRFKDSRTSVESEPRSGRPSTCRNDQVIAKLNAVVMRGRRVTIREIAQEVGISTFSAHSIVTEDLAIKRVAAKFVPKLLTAEQKQLRVEISQDMLDSANSDSDFMNTIITGDKSWVYRYDPETKSQSSWWKHSSSPRPKKAHQVRINVKVMLTAFFDSRGVVHHEYGPQGQTITKEYSRYVLRCLRDVVRRKRPVLWSTGTWRLHHDNAPAHSSHLIQTFLAKNQTPVLQRAPYSPDMVPCDFWLFPKLKRPLKGTRFQTREDIMAATTAELKSIPKEAFSACFQ